MESKEMPDFTMKSLDKSEEKKFSDFMAEKKPILIDFYTTW